MRPAGAPAASKQKDVANKANEEQEGDSPLSASYRQGEMMKMMVSGEVMSG